MKRVMVNLDDGTGQLLEQKIQAERRSASSYIVLLIEQDLRAAGLLPPVFVPDRKEIHAQLDALLDAAPRHEPEVKKFLVTRLRKSRTAA